MEGLSRGIGVVVTGWHDRHVNLPSALSAPVVQALPDAGVFSSCMCADILHIHINRRTHTTHRRHKNQSVHMLISYKRDASNVHLTHKIVPSASAVHALTLCERSASTTLELNPHRGASGTPCSSSRSGRMVW